MGRGTERGLQMGSRGKRCSGATKIALAVTLSLLALPAVAEAAPPEFLTRITSGEGKPGSGAGEVDNAWGIAGNPVTGHIYVSDLNNARIDEYTTWGLFVKAWGWGVRDGFEELQTCGPAEPEESPEPGLCQRGSEGPGEGQLARPFGIATDSAGNVFVHDSNNFRIQKFDPAAQFIVMFGGKVNKTKVEEGAAPAQQNVCPVDPVDICQAGSTGEGPSHLSGTVGNYVAYSPTTNAIVVGDEDRIQIFNLDGTYREEIPFEGALAAFEGRSVTGLDVDSAGIIYLSLSGLEDVYKLSASGAPLSPGKPGESKFDVGDPTGVAVDAQGSVHAIDKPVGIPSDRVLKFDAAGNRLVPTQTEAQAEEFFPFIPFQGPSINGIGTNFCAGSAGPNLYVAIFKFGQDSYVDAYGPPPTGCEAPPPRPPQILDQYATSVGTDHAVVQARINPRFWEDTTYFVEYGEGICSEGGCGAKTPVPAALLTDQVTNQELRTAGVVLAGLEPGITYRYRFVAESSGGGPIYGEDPDGKGPEVASFEAGLGGTFTTFELPEPVEPCANDAFRAGPGANLPDCRAYEMVSPLQKENGDAALWVGALGVPPQLLEINKSASGGERFTYSSATAFEGPESAPYVSQYLAERTDGGWASESISPPRSERALESLLSLNPDFRVFSEDLCLAWFRHNSVSRLSEDAVPGYANLYKRENCAEPPRYESLTRTIPPDRTPEEFFTMNVQGFSADGEKAVFVAGAKLTADAPALPDPNELLLYAHTRGAEEPTRFVCRLPGGDPNPTPCGAGTPAGQPDGIFSAVKNAFSADGSRVYWTAFNAKLFSLGDSPATGRLYLRRNPGQEQSAVVGGECTEAEKACTVAISEPVSSDPAMFWSASEDGAKAIFMVVEQTAPISGSLYEFDAETGTSTPIAAQVEGPMGASEDASRIYFAANADLDGGGPATAGAHNLYLYEAGASGGEGSFAFVMALAGGDVVGTVFQPAPVGDVPIQRSARVSDDGLHAVFSSSVVPTPGGYDNRDLITDEPVEEVYRYDAAEDELSCISCNPSGARPTADRGAAARIQGWEALTQAPRVLSEDGSRVFFESFEALVPRDGNGTWDVYQWEEPGTGSCEKADASFGEDAGGCVELISSGESPSPSTFLDADPSGENIFIGTMSSLLRPDYGLNDVYDARVGGGFAEPSPARECEGEACQSPPAPPPGVTPASEAVQGPGNPESKPRPRRCKEGMRKVRRKGKVRCVAKARRRNGRRAAR